MHAVNSPAENRLRYVVDCGEAHLFVYSRGLATVVCVDGEVDAANADRCAMELRRFTKVGTPLILDLSRLRFLGLDGFQRLLALHHEHHTAGLYCGIVSGVALRPLLRIVGDHGLSLVRSVPEALQFIDDALVGRRQMLQRLAR